MIEEHFRRSLGKNYKEPEPTATNSVSITGSVDDHFAKALGETWLQIKNKGSPSSSGSSPNSSPDSHMVNHNHSPSVVSWRRRSLRGICPHSPTPTTSRFQHPCPHHFGLSPASPRECLPAGLLKTSKPLKPALSFYALIEDQPSNNNKVFLSSFALVWQCQTIISDERWGFDFGTWLGHQTAPTDHSSPLHVKLWSWASVCSYMYIKRERKGGVLIINFSSLFFLFVSLTVVLCNAFALWDARRLKEKISEKHFGENNNKPPDCATKETSVTDAYQSPVWKTKQQKAILWSPPSVFTLSPSFSPPLCPVYVIWWFCYCMCTLSDRLGLICTTAVEGKGQHVNTVIWQCTHWGW